MDGFPTEPPAPDEAHVGEPTPAVDALLGTAIGARWRGWAKWLGVGLAAFALILLVGRFVGGGLATGYASQPVVRGDLPLSLLASGRLQPSAVHGVGSSVPGTIRDVLVRDNERVRAGQVLARIDSAPFEQAADQARSLLDARQAALAKALAQQRETVDQLKLYLHVRRQSKNTVPSDREMALARADAAHAADAVDAAQVELASARAGLAERVAQLGAVEIRAPVDGVVLRHSVEPGQPVGSAPGPALFTLAAAASGLRLETALDPPQARMLEQGRAARVLVTLPSGRVFRATVMHVSAMPAPPRPVRSATTSARTAPVGLAFDIADPGMTLPAGTPVSVRVELGTHRDMLIVPDEALRFARASDAARAPGQSLGEAVYTVGSDGTPHRIAVAAAGGDGRRTAVTSDLLQPGMHVITGLR